MSVIIVLLVASLTVSAIFLGAFIWSLRNRQFDDDYSPPRRILFDDAPPRVHGESKIEDRNLQINTFIQSQANTPN